MLYLGEIQLEDVDLGLLSAIAVDKASRTALWLVLYSDPVALVLFDVLRMTSCTGI